MPERAITGENKIPESSYKCITGTATRIASYIGEEEEEPALTLKVLLKIGPG